METSGGPPSNENEISNNGTNEHAVPPARCTEDTASLSTHYSGTKAKPEPRNTGEIQMKDIPKTSDPCSTKRRKI